MFTIHSPDKSASNSPEIKKQFEDLHKACYDVTKCIIQNRELTKNQDILENYRVQLIEKYNAFIDFSEANSVKLIRAFSGKFHEKIKSLKSRVAESFLRLNIEFDFDGSIYEKIANDRFETPLLEHSEESIDIENNKNSQESIDQEGNENSASLTEPIQSTSAQSANDTINTTSSVVIQPATNVDLIIDTITIK